MKYLRVILNGQIVDQEVELSAFRESRLGVFVGDANYFCPNCKKNVFFVCCDVRGSVLACSNKRCMQMDSKISKDQARNKNSSIFRDKFYN